jgi:murein DD-endopeptidase MepM/ murein hydrolase activator NlpD
MSFDFVKEPVGPAHYEPEGIYLSPPFSGKRLIIQPWDFRPDQDGILYPGGEPLAGHNGVDFELPPGTEVLATDQGRVTEISHDPRGYGRLVRVTHLWGESIYAHLQGFSVETGQVVRRGDVLGFSGNSGKPSSPHLHFAIRIHPYDIADGWHGYTDPRPFLDPDALR